MQIVIDIPLTEKELLEEKEKQIKEFKKNGLLPTTLAEWKEINKENKE